MDQFIRDFQAPTVDTLKFNSYSEMRETLYSEQEMSSNGFSLIHNNIQSIHRHFDEFLCSTSEIHDSLHCMILTETWNIKDSDLIAIDNFNLVHNNEKSINKADGIIIYIKKNIDYTTSFYKIGEGYGILVNLHVNTKFIAIFAVYRSPSTCPNEFNNDLENFLKNVNYGDIDTFLIVGDMNINIMDDLSNYAEEYLNILYENGFVSQINIVVTRVTDHSKTCIDHIFARTRVDEMENTTSSIIKTNISDHYATAIKIRGTETKLVNSLNKISIQKLNKRKLTQTLKNETWLDVYNCLDIESGMSNFQNILKKHLTDASTTHRIKQFRKKNRG